MPTVLITGTSTGIGEATTKVLAARGWRVFATMRDLSKRSPLERSLDQAGVRANVELEQLDVTHGRAIGRDDGTTCAPPIVRWPRREPNLHPAAR